MQRLSCFQEVDVKRERVRDKEGARKSYALRNTARAAGGCKDIGELPITRDSLWHLVWRNGGYSFACALNGGRDPSPGSKGKTLGDLSQS